MIVNSNYNKEVWDLSFTFVAPCKCRYCGETFRGRFVEAVHETVQCPKCGRTLDFGDR